MTRQWKRAEKGSPPSGHAWQAVFLELRLSLKPHLFIVLLAAFRIGSEIFGPLFFFAPH